MLDKIAQFLINNKLTISTAESCTGGLVSSMLTDISGSSEYTKLNFVTYANEAKHSVLGVLEETLENFGAVSEECAREMAAGLQKVTGADIALCTTGVAGPTGGTKEKPVGLCYISCRFNGQTAVKKLLLDSNIERKKMKQLFAQEAINFAYETITKEAFER